MSGTHRLVRGISLAFTLGLSACAGDDGPQNFPPPDYGYLPQLHLDVATIATRDDAVPAPDSLPASAPTPPDQALKLMASQRLVATGGSGSGQFVINQATIYRSGDNAVAGRLDVTLTVHDATSQRVGMAHAQVERRIDTGDRTPTSRAVLYDITSQMMQDMNVELAYQIHKSLASWLTDASGVPLTGGVQAQSLGAPVVAQPAAGTSAPAAPAVSAHVAPVADGPDAIFPTGDGSETAGKTPESKGAPNRVTSGNATPGNITPDNATLGNAPPPVRRSPQPGVLSLPKSVNSSARPQ